jgi:catechol 2,3-dioxygenase-like lactoylglutathione lyase family enzyme
VGDDLVCREGAPHDEACADRAMSAQLPAIAGLESIAIDCGNPPTLAAWWQALLDGEVEVDSDGDATLFSAGGLRLDFLKTPDSRQGKNRLHLDLVSADYNAAVQQALAHGATRADDVYEGDRWQVFRDPEGNEFCILRPPAERGH